MSELLISYYEHPALSNAGGKSMAAPLHELERYQHRRREQP